MTVRNDISKFTDRNDAARLLADSLRDRVTGEAVVMGNSLNGMPVAISLAQDLGLPYDLLLHDQHKKDGQELYLNSPAGPSCGLYLSGEYERCTGKSHTEQIRNRTVILTDEGIDNPAQLSFAIRKLKEGSPSRIIVAIPVAPFYPVKLIEGISHEVICLLTAVNYISPGQFYDKHSQVSMREVREMFNPDKFAA